jgi:hypothetical protein
VFALTIGLSLYRDSMMTSNSKFFPQSSFDRGQLPPVEKLLRTPRTIAARGELAELRHKLLRMILENEAKRKRVTEFCNR